MNRVTRAAFFFVLAAIGNADESVSRSVAFENTAIHYESYGEGTEALVFIHGWTCDLTFWRGQAPVYESRRSLLVDLPGHGGSGKPQRSYPMEFFARAVEAAMRDAGVERAILIGHSLGGPIAYAFLRLFPEKAKAVVLVDADVARGSAGSGNPQAQRLRMARRARRMRDARGEGVFGHTIESMFTENTPEELRKEIRSKMLATPKHVRVAALTSPSSLPPPPLDEVFELPALSIRPARHGTQARFESMQRLFPALRLEAWEGAGHFLMMEDPERFNKSLETFLAELR